jgi:hypothetical protein
MAGQVLLRRLPLIKGALDSTRACRIASGFTAVLAGLPEFGTLWAHIWPDGPSEGIWRSAVNYCVVCDL